MLSWIRRDPRKKLQKAYEDKLTKAMHAQRSGDTKLYSFLSKEAEELYQKIQRLETQR